MQNISKIRSYIGFSIKAGKAIFGVDNIILKRSKLILMDTTLSETSKRKLMNYLVKSRIECIELDLSEIVPKDNCKAIALTDKNLIDAIKKAMKES